MIVHAYAALPRQPARAAADRRRCHRRTRRDGGGAPDASSANLPKNSSASFCAVPSIRRGADLGDLAADLGVDVYVRTFRSAVLRQCHHGPPLAKPADPPCPSPEIL
jgi:hypothetical protein